uniref:Potassium channel domain-containing protein n=1 Tax=Setaria digitata TaxID=48799 RepID=A0A915PC38_9BILA
MKPAGRVLSDLLEKRHQSPFSLRVSQHSLSGSKSLSPKVSLRNSESLKSLHDNISDASAKYNERNSENKRKPFFSRFCSQVQHIYKKSFVHSTFPVFILIAYSFLGGLIFYLIEYPSERLMLDQKKAYFEQEKRFLQRIILSIEQVIRQIRFKYSSNRIELNKNIRIYKGLALNRIDKAIYWYVLNIYHLSDQASYKTKILKPIYPESMWFHHFSNNFGQMYALRNYTEQLSLRFWEISLEQNDNPLALRRKMNAALFRFETLTGLTHLFTPTWTFWNAMFLAVTTYTTIGYGNITAQSKLGRLAAMLYATIGIPLLLMILHKLGRKSVRVLERFWNWSLRLLVRILWLQSGKPLKQENQDDFCDGNVPLLLPVCDVTPTNSEDIFVIFGLILVGLALFSMCINFLQIKLEWLFEELLMTVLEEYNQKGILPTEGLNISTKIDLLAIWRMWKKRRHQQKIRRKDTTGSAILLRFKRDRRALFEHIHHILCMVNKGTQTEEDIVGAYINTGKICSDEVCWSEVSMLPVAEHRPLIVQAKTMKNIDNEMVTLSSQVIEPQKVNVITIAERSVASHNTSISSSEQSALMNGSRKCKLNKALKTASLMPQEVPAGYYMYTSPRASRVYTNELDRLLAEVKARIDDCRVLTDKYSNRTTL